MNLFETLFGKAKQVINSGKQALADDSSNLGIAKNTITGIPQVLLDIRAGKDLMRDDASVAENTLLGLPKAVKDTFASTRGYTQEELDTAKPTLKEKAISVPRLAAEITSGIGELTTLIPGAPELGDKIADTKIGNMIAKGGEKIIEFGKPKTAGEAKAMQIVDVASNFIPGAGTVKNVSKTSKIAKVADTTSDVAKYMDANIARRELARGSSTFNTKLKGLIGEAEKKFVDFTMPIEDALSKGKKGDKAFSTFLEQNPSKNVRNQIDRVLRTPNLATQFIKDNALDKVIQNVDNLDHFDEYLVAKHSIDVDTRGIKTGRNLKQDEAIVRELGPKYEESAKVISAYSKKLLDYITESGLISPAVRDTLKERYPNYVPLQRVFSELEDSGQQGSKAVASLGKQSVVQNLVGSDRAIESPVRSLIEKTNQAFAQGEKNKAADLIASYNKVEGNPFSLRKVASTADVAPDMGHISVFRNGKKEVWETTKDIAEAAKALNIEQLNILGKIMAVPVRVARAGITGINPSFIAANVARDQVSSFIMADKGLKSSIAHPVNFLKSLWGAVGHNELYDDWVRAGGGGTAFDMGRDQVLSTVERIRAGRNTPSKILYTVKHPSELLRAVEDVIGRSEELTRIQQFKGHKEAALAKGMTLEEANAAGAAAARENSTNFARRGEWGTVLNSTFLYLNAGIQGSRLLLRNLKTKPIATSGKIATTLLFPAATITYWNLNDPERKKAYDDIQEYEKENNLIIVPPNPVQDENGRWNVIKIPLPAGVGQLANFVRRPIESSQGLDPVKFGEIAATLSRTVSPIDLENPASSLTPQAIKPGLQAYTNKDFYTGKPIVYPSEERLPVDQQVRDNTSGTAKAIADKLGASPIKTEKVIGDVGGGVAKNALNALDRIFTPDQVGGVSITESMGRRFNSAAGNKQKQEAEGAAYAALDKQDAENAVLKKKAEEMVVEISALSKDEAKARLKEIAATDKILFNKIMDVKKAELQGLTAEDKAVVRLGVENGNRAEYIYNKFKELKQTDPKAAKEYLLDLRKKKILTNEVFLQITKLGDGTI